VPAPVIRFQRLGHQAPLRNGFNTGGDKRFHVRVLGIQCSTPSLSDGAAERRPCRLVVLSYTTAARSGPPPLFTAGGVIQQRPMVRSVK
jgi:hypothetical protein